ncbi:LuxR C-terminal-related transcriptional regulator [Enterobacter asburiae]|uniref:helix-turn-helix domain-containing protein n=1 Tax=Scandinavium sp. UTDF21-P1B TaxID=3446379 RepID=UPI0034838403
MENVSVGECKRLVYIITKNNFAVDGIFRIANSDPFIKKELLIFHIREDFINIDELIFRIGNDKYDSKASEVLVIADRIPFSSLFLGGEEFHNILLPMNMKFENILAFLKKGMASSAERINRVLEQKEEVILSRILAGRSQCQIAEERDCSIKTISFYKRRAMDKLNIKSLAEIYQRLYSLSITA